MKSAAPTLNARTIAALRARLQTALARRIVWLTDARRDLHGAATADAALLTILGREHYSEHRKSYPIAGWRDLRRVLAQELRAAPQSLAVIGPLVDDRREVVFYELRPEIAAGLGRTLWLLPESLVLARALTPGTVGIVDRDGFRYCLEPGGQGLPFAGPIASAQLFLLAVGLDATTPVVTWHADEIRRALPRALARVPPSAWAAGLQTAAVGRIAIPWRPLAALAATALVGYLALASIYLSATTSIRERAIAALGAEVETLLKTERGVAQMGERQAAIAAVLNDRRPSLELWRVTAAAMARGAALVQLHYIEGELTLRGHAPSATDVLGALSALPGVRAAKFVAPVRHDLPGQEEFAISLTIAVEPARG